MCSVKSEAVGNYTNSRGNDNKRAEHTGPAGNTPCGFLLITTHSHSLCAQQHTEDGDIKETVMAKSQRHIVDRWKENHMFTWENSIIVRQMSKGQLTRNKYLLLLILIVRVSLTITNQTNIKEISSITLKTSQSSFFYECYDGTCGGIRIFRLILSPSLMPAPSSVPTRFWEIYNWRKMSISTALHTCTQI